MKMQLVAIFDRKSQSFVTLEPTPHIGVTLRTLTELVNAADRNSNIAKWPEDHSLWHLGEWETETGHLAPFIDTETKAHKTLIVELSSLKTATT